MKQIIAFLLTFTITLATFAQKDVTAFMGIPVDGTKSEMIQKLRAKKFTYIAKDDCLKGEFNGHESIVYVVTNKKKVCRIVVLNNIGFSEAEVKVHYNNLCEQFKNNDKYIQRFPDQDYEISEEDNISYEMFVNNKLYQASYYQCPGKDKTIEANQHKLVWFTIFRQGGFHVVLYYDNVLNMANGEDL